MSEPENLILKSYDHLQEQLDWRGPNGKPQGIMTLPRDQAEAVFNVLDLLLTGRRDQIAALLPERDEPCHGPDDRWCPTCGLGGKSP